jgi:transcriptional repressor CTCF
MLIHTDEKPFQCQYCEQTFRQKQLLKRHENIYHNPDYVATTPKEKTHSCPTCNKAFRHKGNLVRHLVQHESGTSEGTKTRIVRVKNELKCEDSGNDNYLVVEVIQDGTEIQYEEEELILADEICEELQEDNEEYALSESMLISSLT